LPFNFDKTEKNKLIELDVESFWNYIFKLKDESTGLRFPSLKSLISAVFSLPHSNAEPERKFSNVNEIKNEKGNKTGTKLLNVRCFLRPFDYAYGINFLNFLRKNILNFSIVIIYVMVTITAHKVIGRLHIGSPQK